MKAEFSFVEYSYNPDVVATEIIHDQLHSLGFCQTAQRLQGAHSFWGQKRAIILLSQDKSISSAQLTGLGFITDTDGIAEINAEFDTRSNLFYVTDPRGITNFFMPLDDASHYMSNLDYEVVPDEPVHNLGLERIPSVIYHNFDRDVQEHYSLLGFRVTQTGEEYQQVTSRDNRFTIMASSIPAVISIPGIVMNTPDIFATTARAMAAGISQKHFKIDPRALDFGDINHLISGYNCISVGNANTYVIENFLPQAIENLDVIVQMKKQYIGLSEDTICEYYDHERA